MLIVPLNLQPSQTLTIVLNNQPCRLNVYQRSTGVFVDLLVNDSQIVGGVIGLDRTFVVIDTYLGFVGDIAFADQQGTNDPFWTGFGASGRYQLYYLLPAEIPRITIGAPLS